VDGRDVGVSPITVSLDPGQHEVLVLAGGYTPWKTVIELEEGNPQSINAVLLSEGFSLWPVALVWGGLSALSMMAASVSALVTMELYDGSLGILPDARTSSYQRVSPSDTAQLSGKRSQVQYAAWVTDGLFGIAIVSSMLSATFFAAEVAVNGLGE